MITRRHLIRTASSAGLLVGLQGFLPAWAQGISDRETGTDARTGTSFDLAIGEQPITIAGRKAAATTINSTVPGPLLRFREGETVTLRVANGLNEDTSIHWHGILLPAVMDGVPNVSFPGIRPGETFVYRYTLKQSGTYWYHSHSGLQEQSGVFGPIIVDPKDRDPIGYDREYVVMLSDWTFEDPDAVFAKLKKSSDYYNFQKRTVSDFFSDVSEQGLAATLDNRLAWGRMRMDPTDIADITGHTYTYLINGKAPESNWTGLFEPGERVRLRFINAAAMTYFNVRIPGLRMTVVQADGQNVQPAAVDEFQIGVAETYDVIVEPVDRAYTIFAESMDRSGYARGTLATRMGMTAAVPELRPRPLLTMADMGMAHGEMGGMSMDGMGSMSGDAEMATTGPMEHPEMPEMPAQMDHGTDGGMAAPIAVEKPSEIAGPGVDMRAEMPTSRVREPGLGLENVDHKVLAYADLRSRQPGYDQRMPTREIELHLTGNMERYIWSFDGKKFSEVKRPISFRYGERLRLTMINDTMMNHPIHLHGMWMELENGAGAHKPRKHTVNVKPGEKLSVQVTADALGDWAFHCHLLYHLKAGMFRVVSVTQNVAAAKP
jgi:CopA family copper-resistance protein